MSPEQVAGRPVDHRTDIFSLGAVLGEMFAGQRTFTRPTPAQTMAAIIQDDPPPASSLNPAVPATLDRIIQRCLEKSPAARFQSASDLAFALSTATGSSGHVTTPRDRDWARYVQIGHHRLSGSVDRRGCSMGRGQPPAPAIAGGSETLHRRPPQRRSASPRCLWRCRRMERGWWCRSAVFRARNFICGRSTSPSFKPSRDARRVQPVFLTRRRMDWILHHDGHQEGAAVWRARRHDLSSERPYPRQRGVGLRRHDLFHAVFAIQRRRRRRQWRPQRSLGWRCQRRLPPWRTASSLTTTRQCCRGIARSFTP